MIQLLDFLINVYILIIIVRVILSWISIDPYNPFVQFVVSVTEPVLSKIRQIVPPMGGLDLSPLVLILALYILRSLIW